MSYAQIGKTKRVGCTNIIIYHGLADIPPVATWSMNICRPLLIKTECLLSSVQVDSETITPNAFAVGLSSGETVTPLCATLRPAEESLERRTVLLIGAFSPGDSVPVSVEIVEQLEDQNGLSLLGLKSENVTSLTSGPSLVLAERFRPSNPGLQGECPEETEQLCPTWAGGVTGPRGMTSLKSNEPRCPFH